LKGFARSVPASTGPFRTAAPDFISVHCRPLCAANLDLMLTEPCHGHVHCNHRAPVSDGTRAPLKKKTCRVDDIDDGFWTAVLTTPFDGQAGNSTVTSAQLAPRLANCQYHPPLKKATWDVRTANSIAVPTTRDVSLATQALLAQWQTTVIDI
jgi:hypothetical protein